MLNLSTEKQLFCHSWCICLLYLKSVRFPRQTTDLSHSEEDLLWGITNCDTSGKLSFHCNRFHCLLLASFITSAAEWPQINRQIHVIQMNENRLSNRFLPFREISTEAVFSLDDDIITLTADEIEFGYQVSICDSSLFKWIFRWYRAVLATLKFSIDRLANSGLPLGRIYHLLASTDEAICSFQKSGIIHADFGRRIWNILFDTKRITIISTNISVLKTWRENPDRLVGYLPRSAVFNISMNKYEYVTEWSNEMNIVLTGASFYHKVNNLFS